jgi:hypothetical protein
MSTSADVAFPRYEPRGTAMMATNTGQLVLRDRCLYLEAGGTSWLLLWPRSLGLGEVGDDLVITRGLDQLAQVGDTVAVGGGETSNDREALELAGSSLPERCATGLYWQVTSFQSQP